MVGPLSSHRNTAGDTPPPQASAITQAKDTTDLTLIRVVQQTLPHVPGPHFHPGLRALVIRAQSGHGVPWL